MERKMLTRYLILITALTIFAGVAWYITKDSGAPRSGAVLAGLEAQLQDSGDCAHFGQAKAGLPPAEEVSHEL